MDFDTGLTHLGLEASIYYLRIFRILHSKDLVFCMAFWCNIDQHSKGLTVFNQLWHIKPVSFVKSYCDDYMDRKVKKIKKLKK